MYSRVDGILKRTESYFSAFIEPGLNNNIVFVVLILFQLTFIGTPGIPILVKFIVIAVLGGIFSQKIIRKILLIFFPCKIISLIDLLSN
jgi:hypothetical protein